MSNLFSALYKFMTKFPISHLYKLSCHLASVRLGEKQTAYIPPTRDHRLV